MFHIKNPYKRRESATPARPITSDTPGSAPPPLLKLLVAFGICLLILLGNQNQAASRSLRTSEVDYHVDESVPVNGIDTDAGIETDIYYRLNAIRGGAAEAPTSEEEEEDGSLLPEMLDDDENDDIETAAPTFEDNASTIPPSLESTADDDSEDADGTIETEPPIIEDSAGDDSFAATSFQDSSARAVTILPSSEDDDSKGADEAIETEPPTIKDPVDGDTTEEKDDYAEESETASPTFDDNIVDVMIIPPSSESTLHDDSEEARGPYPPADSDDKASTANFLSSEPSMRDLLHSRSVEKRDRLRQQLEKEQYNERKLSSLQRPVHESFQIRPGRCDESDAFSGVPISDWTPPNDAPIKNVYEWKESYKSAMKRIQVSGLGGDDLRNFALSEARNLKNLRHQLFCMA